jgi:Short C-terminal domain
MEPDQPPAPPETGPAEPTLRRRWLVRGLVVLGSIVLVLSVLAVWISREALDTDSYTTTSSQLLEQQAIQTSLSTYLVDQLYANVDVSAQLQPLLPAQAQGLAGPAAAALREYAQRAAERLLASDRVQDLWRTANRAAHAKLLLVIDGGGPRVGTAGGDVVLNTGPLVEQLASRLGIQSSPALAGGRIVILHSHQLSAAQTIVHRLKVLAIVLPFAALALFAIAVYLARGRRREAVRACGVGIIAAGIALLLGRVVAGSVIVDSLAQLPDDRASANAAWDVITADLTDATRTVIGFGIITVLWAWISGAGERAVGLRRLLAPDARAHAGRVWAGFAAVVLLLIAWAPTHAARRPLPVVVLTILAASGLEAVRRQSIAEFPDAVGGSFTAGVRSHLVAPPRLGDRADSDVLRLERLAALRAQGALTDEEFEALKRPLVQ